MFGWRRIQRSRAAISAGSFTRTTSELEDRAAPADEGVVVAPDLALEGGTLRLEDTDDPQLPPPVPEDASELEACDSLQDPAPHRHLFQAGREVPAGREADPCPHGERPRRDPAQHDVGAPPVGPARQRHHRDQLPRLEQLAVRPAHRRQVVEDRAAVIELHARGHLGVRATAHDDRIVRTGRFPEAPPRTHATSPSARRRRPPRAQCRRRPAAPRASARRTLRTL